MRVYDLRVCVYVWDVLDLMPPPFTLCICVVCVCVCVCVYVCVGACVSDVTQRGGCTGYDASPIHSPMIK